MKWMLAFASLTIWFGVANAQSFSGSLMTDEGAGVPGYPIIVKDIEEGSTFGKVYFTDENGNFTITDLPPGEYSVTTPNAKTPKAKLQVEGVSPEPNKATDWTPSEKGSMVAVQQRSVADLCCDDEGEDVKKFVRDPANAVPSYSATIGTSGGNSVDIGDFSYSWD